MATVAFTEAYRTHEFVVEIEGIESPGITKVSGLSEGEIDAIDQPDGGSNVVHKISSGIVKYGDLTLERNMDGTAADAAFQKWFQEMFKLDGTGVGSKLRRNGSVVKRQFGKEVMRFAFEGAWIKSSRFSDLDASTSGLMKQTLVLAIERMYRV
ncbi:phage tail protein [Nannocystis punicea]|jgi:phage tail-like protein|uniref:Phage tail protein n=1 Tax=Nannocystis punicea TaxID=2995304 RepID=A0ABY7GVR5_9BACT|nr:phage tail protein [Nannocystis poenicansa]WAS91036.1 phage tail protein [Nannocystis poenicansa]